jgi:hypothetical protein
MLRIRRWTCASARRRARLTTAAVAVIALAAPAAQAAPVAKPLEPGPRTVAAAPSMPGARIIAGHKVAPGGWPWIVSLRVAATGGHWCGGTVVAADLILTAAHCVKDANNVTYPPSHFYVVAKQLALTPLTGERLPVTKIVAHPAWSNTRFTGDAALVFLGRNTTAPPMLMADTTFEASAVGGFEWTAGWGATTTYQKDPQGNVITPISMPNDLQEVQMGVAGPSGCNAALPQNPVFWTDWHLCAGSPPKTTCNGDSGGPHVVQRASDKRWILLGVTSIGWIVKTAAGNFAYCTTYDGITRVAAVETWVIDQWNVYHATPHPPVPQPSADTQKPRLRLHGQRARRRHRFQIAYRVFDNSHETSEHLVIKFHGRVKVRQTTKFGEALNKVYVFTVRTRLKAGLYRIELTSTDRAGNATRAVAKLRVR